MPPAAGGVEARGRALAALLAGQPSLAHHLEGQLGSLVHQLASLAVLLRAQVRPGPLTGDAFKVLYAGNIYIKYYMQVIYT